MATLDVLKARIIREMSREDMGSGGAQELSLTNAITQAIEFYAKEQFWFNRANGSGNTSAATATISMPSGVRYPRFCSYLGNQLRPLSLDDIQYRTETGPPSAWAENEGAIQLWPIPDATYAIGVYGLASTGIPAAGSDTNIWTTEAYDLIVSCAKRMLYQFPFRDPEGAALAQIDESRYLAGLREETRRRRPVKLATDIPPSRPYFNIMTG
jgi:hypothetical protein